MWVRARARVRVRVRVRVRSWCALGPLRGAQSRAVGFTAGGGVEHDVSEPAVLIEHEGKVR